VKEAGLPTALDQPHSVVNNAQGGYKSKCSAMLIVFDTNDKNKLGQLKMEIIATHGSK
jgi:hypothetical protein